MCDCSEDAFRAQATGSGEARTLTVDGECSCPTTGYTLSLEPTNPGIVPHPEDVVLELVETAPQIGGDMITPTPVHYETQIGPEAQQVVIRHSGGSMTIPIVEAPDGGSYGY